MKRDVAVAFLVIGALVLIVLVLAPSAESPNDEAVWCFRRSVDSRAGRVLWTAPENSQELAAFGRDAFVVTREGALERRSLKEGKLVWSVPTLEGDRVWDGTPQWWSEHIWFAGDLCLIEGIDRLLAHNISDGLVRWSIKQESRERAMRWSPIGDGILLVSEGTTSYVDVKTGERRWTISLDSEQGTSVPVPGGDVIVVSRDGVVRLRRGDGSVMWCFNVHNDQGSWRHWRAFIAGPYLVLGETGFFSSDSSSTACIDLETGHELWSLKGAGPGGAAISRDGALVIVSTGGELIGLKTASWKEAWRVEALGECVMEVDKDRLYRAGYNSGACGSWLECFSLLDGHRLWNANVSRLAVPHSKYSNQVTLERRGPNVCLVGHEDAGDYVQTFRCDDGRMVSVWTSHDGEKPNEKARLLLKVAVGAGISLLAMAGVYFVAFRR